MKGITKDYFLLLAALAAWFLCGAAMVMQSDSWWHLRTGQIIWQSKSIPANDIYSFVLPPGTPWPNHEWLSQVILYSLYNIGGLALVNFSAALLVTATAILLALSMTGSLLRRAALLLMVVPWLYTALSVRPQLFSLFFLALLFCLLKLKKYRWLPFLFLLWVQLHAGVIFGGVVLTAATMLSIFVNRKESLQLAIVTLICGIVVSINPMGLSIYTFPFESVARAKTLPLGEWLPPGFSGAMDLYFWFCAAAVILLVALQLRRKSEWNVWLFTCISFCILPIATQHIRNIYMWFLPAAVAASYLIRQRDIQSTLPTKSGYLYGTIVLWVGIIGMSVYSLLNPLPFLQWFPVDQNGATVLKTLPDPIFTTYDCGGFLIWFSPEKKVFIDSRQDPYPLDLLQDTIAVETSGDFQAFFDFFGFRSAVVERHLPLAKALYKAGWKVTYAGPAFLVLEK